MDAIRVVNVIPNSHSNETNQDSEPSIAVNPNNPAEIVVTAFTPPDSGLSDGPIYYSQDGGETWHLNFDVPGGGPGDQTVAFATTSNELYGAILRGDISKQLNAVRTANPAAASELPTFDKRSDIDQPWVEARTVVGGPDNGKDRLFLAYNNDGAALGTASASVDVCLDAQAASPAFTQVTLDPRSVGTGLLDGYAIRPVAHSDGTVYVAYEGWRSGTFGSNITTDIVVARDDNWGQGSPAFSDLKDPGDKKAGRLVQTGVVIDDGGILGQERLNNDLAIAVDPTNSDVVYLAWADNAGANYTLRVRRSLNRGVDWSGDLLTVDNATMACLAINGAGVAGLMYQQVSGANWETHFRRTSDGTNWSDVTLSTSPANTPPRQFHPYLGDWARVVAVGHTFYGVFCANNTPDPAHFPNDVTFQRNHTTTAPFNLLGTDGVTTVGVSIDPFFFRITEVDCTIVTDRNTFGQDDINAMLHQSTPAVISAAFYVTVDGFRADELGITNATLGSHPDIVPAISFNPPLSAPPAGSSRVVATFCSVDGGVLVSAPQRFTWTFAFQFFDDSDFTQEIKTVTMTASRTSLAGVTVSDQAVITLTTQPNPYETDGPTSWLSVDLQVFPLLKGGSLPSTPTIKLDSDPNAFITQLLRNTSGGYNDPALPRAPNHPFDLDLVAHQDTSSVEIAGTLGPPPGIPVYNFAVARVRYRALANTASNVRVFFRIFQASTTSTDFQPASTYLTGGVGTTKIPLLGVVNGEVVTIPCFAAARVDPTKTNGLNAQTDPVNVGPVGEAIPADGSGAEVQVYFGCWLDINQTTAVLPAAPASAAGPFTPTQSIQQAIRGKHQCLVAEINLDPPEPQIITGATPANSDKLAQRNLTIAGVASPHLVPQSFDIKPTAASLKPGQAPDEIMIDWGNLPAGSQASIYLPGTNAQVILEMANKMYTHHGLASSDDHTLTCKASGITFVPIPPGTGSNYAALMTIDVPATVEPGQTFKVITRQITNASAVVPPPGPEIEATSIRASNPDGYVIEWRRVKGTFQLTIPVTTTQALLDSEERLLSVLRWIEKSIPQDNRWFPVSQRHIEQVAGRVQAMGGDPKAIGPSSSGNWYHPRDGHGGLVITFADEARKTVSDLADIFLRHLELSDRREIRCWPTETPLLVRDLISTHTGIYELQALPHHHRAVGRFVTINDGQITQVQLEVKS